MHTVHVPQNVSNNMHFAAMGILFSVENYNIELSYAEQKIIDNFFDSMVWNETSKTPLVDLITYGDLMNLADMRSRWVYKGSVTSPPC